MSKVYYKIEILYDKFSPFIIGSLIFIDNVLTYLGITFSGEGYLFMPSLLTSFHMYVSRRNFLLCRFHRVIVNYCVINSVCFAIKDISSTRGHEIWLAVDLLITLIIASISIYYYQKDKVKC